MNILEPELVWVEGRCFRKLPIKDDDTQHVEEYTKTRVRVKEETGNTECDDVGLPIIHKGDRFFITILVPEPLVGLIQGRKGVTRKSIEEQTSTQITVPKVVNKDADCDITIVGRNKENVAAAYRRIEFISKQARWKGDYTHFVSIPMNDPTIIEGFCKFKKDVLANYRNAQGINESLFESPPKLHITIAMLTLLNSREKETASGVLLKHKDEILHILGGKSLRIEVKGVEYMNDDPSEVDVLYGLVRETDSDNCLQIIADKLADAFANADLSRRELRDHIKLHVTLMKSRSSNAESRGTFDARKILQNYAEYTFGQMTVNEIHISVRFTGGMSCYYTSTFVLNLSK